MDFQISVIVEHLYLTIIRFDASWNIHLPSVLHEK